MIFAFILLLGAIVCFGLAAFRFPSKVVDLVPLGLALWACASFISRV